MASIPVSTTQSSPMSVPQVPSHTSSSSVPVLPQPKSHDQRLDHIHSPPSSSNDQLTEIANGAPEVTSKLGPNKKDEVHETRLQESSEDGEGSRRSHAGRWTTTEHRLLLEALSMYGNLWKKVCEHVGTRSPSQARSHAQKYFSKLKVKEIRKMRNSAPSARKLFAITREYLNRTVAPAKLLEVPENVYKRAKKSNDPKRPLPQEPSSQPQFPLQCHSQSTIMPPSSQIPLQQQIPMPGLYSLPSMFQGGMVPQPPMYFNRTQCSGMSPFCRPLTGPVLPPYGGLARGGPYVCY